MKEDISKSSLRILVVVLSLILIWNIIMSSNKVVETTASTKNTIDSLIYLNDSLKYEVFIEHTVVDRYEIALEELREDDSVSAKKFEEKLSNIE